MNEESARELLGSSINKDNSLYNCGWYLDWPNFNNAVTMDGEFTVKDIEAILWWVNNKKIIKQSPD